MPYELIIKTDITGKVFRSLAREAAEEIRRSPALAACEIVEGPAEPHAGDCVALDAGLLSGDFEEDDFGRFCAWKGLPIDQENVISAAEFLDARWGVVLATVRLPSDERSTRAVYAELIALAKARNWRINDPQQAKFINPAAPGDLPPNWKGL